MEPIINIFFYGDEQGAHSLGYCRYFRAGEYDEHARFLRERVYEDHVNASQLALTEKTDWAAIPAIVRSGDVWELLEELGVSAGFDEPYCVTYIVNGQPRFDEVVDEFAPDAFPDYLRIYLTGEGFDFSQLINDDYHDAIKLLWNNNKYISAVKLMLSMIDTLGYIEFGDKGNCFVSWLNDYSDMNKAGVTAEELWELRNGLLHMSNLDSRRTRTGAVNRLLIMVTAPDAEITQALPGYKGFHVSRFLLEILPNTVGAWLQSYNLDRSKFRQFVERYDAIVSEARMGVAYRDDLGET